MALGLPALVGPDTDTRAWESIPADTLGTADSNLDTWTWLAGIANDRTLKALFIQLLFTTNPQTTLGSYTGPYRSHFVLEPAIVGAIGDTPVLGAAVQTQGAYQVGMMVAQEEIDAAVVYLRALIPVNLTVEGQFGLRLRIRRGSEIAAPVAGSAQLYCVRSVA